MRIDFDAGLDVAAERFQAIRDVLDSMNMGKVCVDAVPIYEEAK